MRVAVGGTFDGLHGGHERLLRMAADECHGADAHLWVGVAVGELAARPERHVRPWSRRADAVRRFLRGQVGYVGRLEIGALETPAGPILSDPNLTVLVASEESAPVAIAFNKQRPALGMKSARIVACKMVIADDGARISATRLHKTSLISRL